MTLYENLELRENPFSTSSAEEEKEFLGGIYLNPLFYSSLKSNILKEYSRFIIGARGIGKTALLIQLKSELRKNNAFVVMIDDYEDVPITKNRKEFIRLIIEELITKYSIEIGNSPRGLKKLSKSQKEKLSFIIKEFFKTLSKSEYEELYNKADRYKRRNFFKKIWNYIFNRPINFTISGTIEVIGETVRKSLGLPTTNNLEFYKNYIPELTIEEIEKEEHPEKFLENYKALKNILNDLGKIIKASGFASVTVFFDKIDEYPKLNSSINSVSTFLEELLKDTTLLMNDSYSLVFSIWNVLKPDLTNKGVRFDKIKPTDITWKPQDIKRILTKRIQYFSLDKTKDFEGIFPNKDSIDEIIELSNNSPRYLFRLLSYIYDQQNELNPHAKKFSDEAIRKGKLTYSKNFEYYSIYPSKRGSKEDILKNINRLLKIGKTRIKSKDFADTFKVSSNTANSYIGIDKNYNLIKELSETENGAKVYEVVDPVIIHLIKNKVMEIEN